MQHRRPSHIVGVPTLLANACLAQALLRDTIGLHRAEASVARVVAFPAAFGRGPTRPAIDPSETVFVDGDFEAEL